MGITNSIATKGIRGMIGGTLVFKSVNGQTVVSAAPGKSTKVPTIGQIAQRERFRLASFYAIRATNDPELLAVYTAAAEKKGTKNLRSVMMADYFDSPEILTCKVEDSKLQPGTKVLAVLAISSVQVKSLNVSVTSTTGTAIESGNATLSNDAQTWIYEFEDESNLTDGVTFDVTATSLSGNVTAQSFDFNQ